MAPTDDKKGFSHSQDKATIIDIRGKAVEESVLDDIKDGLRPKNGGEKKLPTLLLYDDVGLRLFEDITYLEDYYLTNAEIEVLEAHADKIAAHVAPGSLIVELGSGNLRKVNILLQAIERLGKTVEYYALDVSYSELERTLSEIPGNLYKYVNCFALQGTYDDGLQWLKRPENRTRPKIILSLGSSIGNFTRPMAVEFLRGFAAVLDDGDAMLVGIDACKEPDRVSLAYNDSIGTTHKFILNGLAHAGRLLGAKDLCIDAWRVIGEYDIAAGRHQAFLSPKFATTLDGISIAAGERIRIEESYKYSAHDRELLLRDANLVERATWSNQLGNYSLHMVSRPGFGYPLHPELYAPNPVPSIADWSALWFAWDSVTRKMISRDDLLSKPVKLRNAYIFYLGHIPTFLDMHVARAAGLPPTEPDYYLQIFERGIDPDVDNPDQCHAHSEIPDSWPAVEEILSFQERVRNRVRGFYDAAAVTSERKMGRALWLAFEHEAMHLETLLYMLIQSEKIAPPPDVKMPDFRALAAQAEVLGVPNEWITVPQSVVELGMDDPENENIPTRYFGWDNEKPRRVVEVGAFAAKARPITVGEYTQYLAETGVTQLPASWIDQNSPAKTVSNGDLHRVENDCKAETNGVSTLQQFSRGKAVRTVFGFVPLDFAAHWPIVASYDEIAGCAAWMGGRIPKFEEVRSIYNYVEQQKIKEAQKSLGKRIPAVNAHLLNDGVEESPPSTLSGGHSGAALSPNPHQLFISLEHANVGFRHWHPMPVTQNGNKLSGQGELGGVWEWTSSVLEKYDGFEPTALYPGYTADFFDGKHNFMLGGSWATHPRIAGRKSFINWYQRNYPYVWAGARLVRDI